jgi:hypothetical protein
MAPPAMAPMSAPAPELGACCTTGVWVQFGGEPCHLLVHRTLRTGLVPLLGPMRPAQGGPAQRVVIKTVFMAVSPIEVDTLSLRVLRLLGDHGAVKNQCKRQWVTVWKVQAGHCSGVKPTVIWPEGQAITGRLMVLACASMTCLALALSVTPACTAGIQLAPGGAFAVEQSFPAHQWISQVSSCASGTPCFLKS